MMSLPSRCPGHLLLTLVVALCLAPAWARTDDAAETDQTEDTPASVDNKEVQGLLNLGRSMGIRGDYHAGVIAYRQALEKAKEPESVKAALLGLARMHRMDGSFTKSVALYQRLIRDYPNDALLPDILLEIGRTQRAMGANKSALRSFYSVINSTLKIPTDLFDHYQLLTKTAQFEIAETHFAAGNYKDAAKFFTRVQLLELAPADRARALFKSAYAQQLGGDLAGAVITIHSFLEKYPQDENVPEARYLLSTILRALNRPEEALTATLELLREEQARTDTNPKNWVYWQRRTGNQLANEFFISGDTANALAIYQHLSALSEDPRWRLPILYQTALCYERLRQVGKAQSTYESIVMDTEDYASSTSEPELADLHRMASWRLNHLSWYDRTERDLTQIFSTTTGQPTVNQLTNPPPSANHDATGDSDSPSSNM